MGTTKLQRIARILKLHQTFEEKQPKTQYNTNLKVIVFIFG